MYMIVGIKVSHRATVTHAIENKNGISGEASVLVNLAGKVDGKMKVQREVNMWDHQEELEYDFVYAYRLKKCARHGRGYRLQEKPEAAPGGLFSADDDTSAFHQGNLHSYIRR